MTHEPELQPRPDLVRPMLESAIERLIAILDVISPDPDLEDTGEDYEDGGDGEPLYGWTEMQGRLGHSYGPYGVDADGCELDEAESEPELGSLEQVNQLHWAKGRDGEPSLGAPEAQSGSWRGLWPGDSGDREADTADDEDNGDAEPECEDEGAQCDDEGVERSEPVGAEDWAFPDVLWADHVEVARRKAVRS